jgi:hypothetical protein
MCGCSVIRAMYDEEDPETYIHVFTDYTPSLWDRIKNVFYWRTGNNAMIEVVLSEEDVYKLEKFLKNKPIVEK